MYYNLKFDESSAKTFEQIGVNLELLLREAEIPPRAVQNSNFQLTADQYKGFINAMDRHMDKQFIVAISKVDTVASFNPEFFAGLCAENGMKCIERIAKFKIIIAPVRMNVVEGPDRLQISYAYDDGSSLPRMMLVHAHISILSIIRKGTGVESLLPIKVASEYDYPDEAIDYLGISPIKSKKGNEIAFSKEDLKRPFITENNRMWDYLESELNQRLRELEVDLSFSSTVRKTLLELLPAGISDADKISRELGVSKRTLQRRLKEENTSFNEQLNHTRELMVRNYLRMDMTLNEIAFLINYSDAKSLSRAFRVWTGMSITDYRSEM
ncbi:AraC family transcriptional regulator [Vallitalea okinawensis]|uniref:AraC family transcriptional regulator n=1 Tax=Vallitalea okinawensis TaxID=2078660 RepID=UPI00147947CF|nr:AraC family transcriptional regulator [Vallitalea okinawensis]